MEKQLIARGQATILVQKDSYTVHQSVGEYIFPASNNGALSQAVTFSSTIKVTLGDDNLTNFTIGTVTKPAGFSAITVNNTNKTVTYSVAAGTTTMADSGLVTIPVTIAGQTYNITFSYAKAKAGAAGVDSNMLDWVSDWNSAKTVIGSQSVITPKLFAGTKNANGTITGVAIGKFPLSTVNASGAVSTETINGIYGFKDGYKTFSIDTTGSVLLGKGNQFIRYNPANGKIEFGSEVTLNWVNAINTAKTEAINSAAATAQAKADAAKNAAIAAAAADATGKVGAIRIAGRNYIRNSNFTAALTGVIAEGTSISIDTATLYNNYRTLKVIQNTACTDANAASQRTYFMAINSRVCAPASFSMYVKGSVASVMKIRIGISGIRTVNITTAWQRFVLENITPTSAVVLFGFQTVGTYWCALPMLVEGSKAVDWSPAPEDLFTGITDARKAGTDAKAVADAITNKANTEGWATKLTYIGSTGIFTGTLSANTVNAVRINASQITAGTIDAARINVAALKTSLITAGNIEALTLNVTKGKVGGWSLDADSVYRGSKNNTSGAYTGASGSVCIGSNGIRGFKWRLDATGAGAVAGGNISWDAAGNVTFGATVILNWTTPINTITTALGGTSFPKLTKISSTGIYTGTLTATQVNAVAIDAGSITTGALSADRIATGSITSAKLDAASIKANIINTAYINGLSCTFVRGTIGGWRINSTQIYKNSVYLGSDGSITNSTKWKFNNDGSGQVANGNISWNAAGAVTFGTSVSLQWKNDIETSKTTNYGYRYYKKIVVNGSSGTYYPVVFKGGDQTIKRDILIRRSYSEQAPTDWDNNSTTHKGGLSLLLKVNFGGWGGASYSWDIYELSEIYSRMFAGAAYCGNYCMFAVYLRGGGDGGAVYHLYSDQPIESATYSPSPIPPAPQIAYNSDRIFQSGTSTANAPAPRILTAAVEEEIRRHRFIGLAQGNDTTLKAHPLTYIGSTGIYTGTLTANQVNAVAINAGSITAGTLSADRIAAGSITSTKLDAASIKANIINTGYINGLSCTFVRGTIGGWTINSTQIYKNNVYLSSDGSISNGTKWKLNNDGSGQIAGGSITWNAAGAVTFASSVSLNWTNAATNALNSAKSYADTKKTEAVDAAASDATNKTNAAKELALAMAFGKMMYRDPEFRNGNNGINVYNNNGNGTVTIVRTGLSSAPNDSKTVLEIKNIGSATPGIGGFYFGTPCSNRKVFIVRIIAKIPVGRNIQWASNAIGASGSSKWLTPNAGKGDWAEYIYKVTCGTSNFSSTNFFYLDGAQGTTATPVIWHVAYATVFDTTSSERYTTTIDANGVYTGTVRAGQVLIDSALVVGGSTYNGSISVRDAGNNVKATLDRTGITAVAGKIGGWNINSGSIYACAPAGGHRVYITSSGYIYNDDGTQDYWGLKADGSATFGYGKILFDNDGSGYVANQNIKWDAKGNVEIRGNITANSGVIAGFTISGNKLVNTAADSSIEFSSMMGNASMTINGGSALLSLRADSARKGIFIQTYATGAVGLSIIANAGSNFAIESYGPVQFGQRAGERWCVPGVLYIGCKYNSGNSPGFSKIWGEGCNVTSSYHLGNAQYKFYHNLGHTNYTVFAQGCQSTGYYGFFRLLERASSYFVIQNVGSSGKPDGSPFDFVIYGRNKWY
ncbi:gp58-like family protein [Bacteroides thetaiotaomicron]|uniref:beta strand repeat-containing protein n=1 Tax=Bacteroides thetaiotaomicron TaxID=818 RepID=UPI002165BE25|nr:gp58-like family protein [Bacteroides thetaiotaomicron]MCS3182617.1 gp58-like family protein [Bacteroides thetaiotaomicron]